MSLCQHGYTEFYDCPLCECQGCGRTQDVCVCHLEPSPAYHGAAGPVEVPEIRVRWLDCAPDLLRDSLLVEAVQKHVGHKDLVLSKLGIQRHEGETYLQAYIRAMHEENGLEPQLPAARAIRDALETNAGAMRLVFVLA